MKIYLLLEEFYKNGILDWYNVYPYKSKDTVYEHIANEVNEPKEDIKHYFEDTNYDYYECGHYIYRIEESEVE